MEMSMDAKARRSIRRRINARRKKIKLLDEQITLVKEEINQLQKECTHEKADYQLVGSYSESRWWRCPTCGHSWI